jgi:hypothetical protein
VVSDRIWPAARQQGHTDFDRNVNNKSVALQALTNLGRLSSCRWQVTLIIIIIIRRTTTTIIIIQLLKQLDADPQKWHVSNSIAVLW